MPRISEQKTIQCQNRNLANSNKVASLLCRCFRCCRWCCSWTYCMFLELVVEGGMSSLTGSGSGTWRFIP